MVTSFSWAQRSHRLRRADALAARGCCRGDALVPRLRSKAPINGFSPSSFPPGHLFRTSPQQCASWRCWTGQKAEQTFKPIRRFGASSTWSVRFHILSSRACSMLCTPRFAVVRKADFVREPATKPSRCTSRMAPVADNAVDDAPMPGRRRGSRRKNGDSVVLSRRVGPSHGRRGSGPANRRRSSHGQGLLGGVAPIPPAARASIS